MQRRDTMCATYTYDYIQGSDIYVYQRKDMFRINTDTSLLAHFMRIEKGERVLDIGTNNGALLLAAARALPSYLYGIEIQEAAVALAKYNMEQANIQNAKIIHADVNDIDMPKVDVVVCNPPYFPMEADSNVNVSTYLTIARHEQYLTLDALANKVSQALQEKGRFYLVHRAERLCDIMEALRIHRLEPKKIQFVYRQEHQPAYTVLIEAIKDGKVHLEILSPKYLHR